MERRWSYGVCFAVGAGLGAVIIVLVGLWAYVQLLATLLLLFGCGYTVLHGLMAWQHHQVELEAKRNRARIIHESENGFGFVDGGAVRLYTHSLAQAPALSLPEMAETGATAPEPRTFGELVDGGYIGPGLDYVLGFGEGGPIRMPLLTSLGIGGFPGAGKTVTTLLLMLETIIKYNGQVSFLVVDPHKYVAGSESLGAKTAELGPFFLTLQDVRMTVPSDDLEYHALLDWADQGGLSSVVEGGEEMKGWLSILELEMDRRIHGKEGDTWVVVFDEFASVMDGPEAKRVGVVLRKMNREARKLKMFALLSSVDWKAANAGGTDVRNAIASFVLHGMPQALAELIAPDRAAREAPTLEPGEMVLYSHGKTTRGRVPYAGVEDARRVVGAYYPRGLVRVLEVKE